MSEWKDQFGVWLTEEEYLELDRMVLLANEQLSKLGLGDLLFIAHGYPFGTAWLIDATGVMLDGDAHPKLVDRERADEPVGAVRRLLVRTLHRYRRLR